jgi:hypothetical protein
MFMDVLADGVGVRQRLEHLGDQGRQHSSGRLVALLCCIKYMAQQLLVCEHVSAVVVEDGLRQCWQANQVLL